MLQYSDADDSNPDEENVPNYARDDDNNEWIKDHKLKQRLMMKSDQLRAKIASGLKENSKSTSTLLNPGS